MTQQEAFEAWAASKHIDTTRDGFGGYESRWTEGASEGWRAAQPAVVHPIGGRPLESDYVKLTSYIEALEQYVDKKEVLWKAYEDVDCDEYDKLRKAALQPQATALTACNCRWDGETQVQSCTLHEAHVDAIHEWAERAKGAEAKLAAQAAVEPVGKVLEVAADGSFQTGFFEELPVGTLLYTSPPDPGGLLRDALSNLNDLADQKNAEIDALKEAMRLALEALQLSRDDVEFCLAENLQLAGYERYDKRIAFYKEQLIKHDAAIAALEGVL